MTSQSPKPTASHAPAPTRHCFRGDHDAPASKFANNADWAENAGRDLWCKDCVAKLTTRSDMMRYCWENHRAWSEDAWSAAIAKAREQLAGDKTYLRSNGERRKVLEERFACQSFPAIISKKTYYKYFDPAGETFDHAMATGRFVQQSSESPHSTRASYSPQFNGNFSKEDLAYLEEFYNNLGGDEIDDYIDREYIKKLAKASLAANKAQDDYNSGRGSIDDVNRTLDNFDKLAKSSNLTAFQKKAKATAAKTSWSEWSKELINKEIYAPVIHWPKDDIDRTLEEFQHIVSAVQGGVEK